MIDLKENLKLKVVPAISVDTNNWIYDVLIYSNISSDIKFKHYDDKHNYICYVTFKNNNYNGNISWNLVPNFDFTKNKLQWISTYKKIINFQNINQNKLIKLAKIKFNLNYPNLMEN